MYYACTEVQSGRVCIHLRCRRSTRVQPSLQQDANRHMCRASLSIHQSRSRAWLLPAQGSARERAPVSVPSVSLVDDTRSFRLSGLHPFVLRAKDPALQYARLALTQNVRASCCSSRVPEPEEDPLEPRCVWTRALLIRGYAALAQQTVCIDLVSCRRKAIVTSWTEAERTISFAICRSSSGERRRRMHPRLAKGSMSKSSRVV